MLSRRSFLVAAAAAHTAARAADTGHTLPFGIGNYGMKSLSTADAIRLTSETGYDCMELTLMDGWTTEARRVPKAERKQIYRMLRDEDLLLPSLLETIPVVADPDRHRMNLERLKRDAEFAHDVYPERPPVLQTHPGGKTEDWDRLKSQVVDHLGQWGEIGRGTATVICIKGHHTNIIDTPERLAWAMRQVNSPWIRVIYDYSHFEVAGFGLGESLDLLLPYTKIISLKDSNRNPKDYRRLLPGDGQIDYIDYFRRLKAGGYDGAVVVEVSGQIHSREGYDPVATTRYCYRNLLPYFDKAGVRRRARKRVRAAR